MTGVRRMEKASDGPPLGWPVADLSSCGASASADLRLIENVLRHVNSGRPALDIGGRLYGYDELLDIARRWAACLRDVARGRPRRVGILAYRSETSYVGVLASLFAGAAFVPLNPRLPPLRTSHMMDWAELDAVLVGSEASSCLEDVLDGLTHIPPLLLPGGEASDFRHLRSSAITGREAMLRVPPATELPIVSTDDPAYLLFTSGSTGFPKCVVVTHANLNSFLAANIQRYGLTPDDRLTQSFDQTFDLSVFDLFMAWHSGACVCAMHPIELLAPFRFLSDHRVTVWFSVPSVAASLAERGLLVPGCMPTLRWSLFCGEALRRITAEAWQTAAPESRLENLYGPTELTVACASYRWDPHTSPGQCEHEVVPIGTIYEGLTAIIVDTKLCEVPRGEPGELCVSGPQTFPGYWRDPAATTASVFDRLEHDGVLRRYYRTGDIVAQRVGHMVFLGRSDRQIKRGGYRVELGEIDAALLRAGATEAVAFAWPDEQRPDYIVAAVRGGDPGDLSDRLASVLPGYMMPRSILLFAHFPRSSHGKIDRAELRRMIARRHP